ncbi:MAG: succinate dehydrogenase assembly factor 2 [Pseudomonadota bacterium]
MSDLENRRKKLLYRATYRGFKEADLLFGGFAKAHIAEMTDAELDEFEALLKLNDRELYEWAIGKKEPPANISGPVFTRLCAFKLKG